VDLDFEALRPGLTATYRSLSDREAVLVRVDLKPAFTLGHSSPHPRLPAGPFEVTWTGVLWWKETGAIAFDAHVGGELTVEIDGVTVLKGRGETDTAHLTGRATLERERGLYRLRIVYRSLAGVSARVQIGWQGPGFAREPLPSWQLKHASAELPEAARQEAECDRGKAAVIRLGCARCHRSAFPGISEPPPGPALADLPARVSRSWLLSWLKDPAVVHSDARMPALFADDRSGFVERWLVAEHLLGAAKPPQPETAPGDHRAGRLAYVSLGCIACHQVPDLRPDEQSVLGRYPLRGLGDRLPPGALATFLLAPHGRYPDGRMPRLPLTQAQARDLAAYLLLWSPPSTDLPDNQPPTKEELAAVLRRLNARTPEAAGAALLRERRCASCHAGLGDTLPVDVPLAQPGERAGCLSGKGSPRFPLAAETAKAVDAYRRVAGLEKHPSPFAARQRQLERAGCLRCHQRDSDRPPPIEEIASTLGGAHLQSLPFQRTPRLTDPHQKYARSYLVNAVREGVSGLRVAGYSYRMPAFGADAEALVQALAEGDGELPAGEEPVEQRPADPTLGSLHGVQLAGFQGYGCVSCHVWQGRQLSQPDPGAIGTDLTRLAGRVRRDWFDRFLENPARSIPHTPMPGVFLRGKPALLTGVLDGDAARQKDALWSYFALGKDAPSPKPPPPLAVQAPAPGSPPLVAQIPIRPPGAEPIEALALLYGTADLVLYDLGTGSMHSVFRGGRILREVLGRTRRFHADGEPVIQKLALGPAFELHGKGQPEAAHSLTFSGYDLLPDGARLRWRIAFASATVEMTESVRLHEKQRRLDREVHVAGVPGGHTFAVCSGPPGVSFEVRKITGEARSQSEEKRFRLLLQPDREGQAAAVLAYELPGAKPAPVVEWKSLTDPGPVEGALERPGYRAIAYPRPKTDSGEDLVMPGAVAVNPQDGRVFVASMKMGEVFVVRDPTGDGKTARFEPYARGLFQETYGLLAEPDALYVLHRRNVTRLTDAGRADRVFGLPHGIADTYDYGYGLVRERTGGLVMSFAPYANTHLPGSGGAIRLVPGKAPQEIAYGMRNPFGWCAGPEGDVFFTDNQGEWVATNKLCHLDEDRYYGFPNRAQPQLASKPAGKAAVWVPYEWARSLNGVTYDQSEGKFGPFAGQFFLAELMFGGAIVRASLEKVNGTWQGAAFPFWGKGLLGPLCLSFDLKGRLWVGSITEPGWMAQPDRGALYRIDFIGTVPFEIQTIRVRPRGFRLVFTTRVSEETARNAAAYAVEHYRYEYTGAYGSPELDRTRLPIERVEIAADGRSVDLITGPLVKDRVYLIAARGVRAAKGEALVHPQGAYTLHEIP
jgi:mono/diheme cytochrome c family protein